MEVWAILCYTIHRQSAAGRERRGRKNLYRDRLKIVLCVGRMPGTRLDPMNTNLVVADESRTDKTICLAVTPSLKSFGIPGRARLFEVKERFGKPTPDGSRRLRDTSSRARPTSFSELRADLALAVDFLIAPPRMAFYMEYSTRVYQVYMKYIAPEDVIVYSIDEVFMDVTDYLNTYR